MRNWKHAAGKILAFIAMAIVAGSTVEDLQHAPQSVEQVRMAIATFVSVFILQWLLWLYVVPPRSGVFVEVTSCFPYFPPSTPRSFFGGTLLLGYTMIAFYCAKLSGYLQTSTDTGNFNFLVTGLLFIVAGTAARIRDAFAEMGTRA